MVTKRSLRNKESDDEDNTKVKNNNTSSPIITSSKKDKKKQSKKEEKKNKQVVKQSENSDDSNSEDEQVQEKPTKSKNIRLVSELSKNVKLDSKENDVSSQLATVRFLRSNGEKGLEKLTTNYHLKVKKHSHFSNLFSLKYDMLKSPFSTDIVQECRGLVLDKDNNYKVVCYPFKKFFNYGEKHNASKDINWKEARVYEKIDGSLCSLYYYGDMWWISTTGTASGNGYLHNQKKTFDRLFWDLWKKLGYQFPDPKANKIYMFELFSNEHTIIVKPERDRIVLLGVRDLTTLKEEDPVPIAEQMKWECVESFPLYTSVGMVFDAARNLDPSKHEGFVVCDSNFNRIKIKSPQYVALAHLVNKDDEDDSESQDSPSQIQSKKRKMLQIVRSNESSEFLAYYPNLEEIHTSVKSQYDKLISITKEIASDIKGKYYSNNEEETSNKDAIVNFIQRKCQIDYPKLLISILDLQNPNIKVDEEEMKTSKKFSKIIKQTITIAVYQEMFGN